MNDTLQYTLIDGIKCYSPNVARAYDNYPENGFELTDINAENSFWVSSRNRLFKHLINNLIPAKGKLKLLEIGCGTGDFIKQITPNANMEITGSEIYLRGLVSAKNKCPQVDFIQYDVAQGRLESSFDVIAAFDVLEHMEDDNMAIHNIANMLPKGGVAIISVPQYMFMWSRLDEIVKHKRRYSKKELINKLIKNNFDINICTSFVFFLFPLMLISRVLERFYKKSESTDEAFKRRVVFSSALNRMMDSLMRLDERLIKKGFSLPFGGTLVIVARKNL